MTRPMTAYALAISTTVPVVAAVVTLLGRPAVRLSAMRTLAWALWAIAIALAGVGAAFVWVNRDVPVPDNWGFRGYWDVVGPVIATVGLLIARQQPRNSIGWILLVAGTAAGFGGFVQEYATDAVLIHPGALPGAVPLAWLASWTWTLMAGPMVTIVPQVFPTGRPLTPRWRPLLWVGASFVPLEFVLVALAPGPMENATFLDNPLPVSGALAELREALDLPIQVLMVAIVLASVASMVVRFRRARGVERQQLKWMAAAAALCGIASASMMITAAKAAQIATVAALMTIPVAIGVAILRYRLYDIDVLIRRTLIYAALSAVLVGAYIAGVALFQTVLAPFTSGNGVAVAASTLGVVALFQPVRTRVQRAVDRRFYRSKYDAERTLDAFAARLREQIDLGALEGELLAVVDETLQPARVTVWLRR